MDNFYQVASGMDVAPLMASLKAQPNLWNENDLRTTYKDSVHSQVNDIWLRFNEVESEAQVFDDTECINYPGMYSLPEAQNLLFWLMSRVRGERLGRCIITELKPGKCIAPHVDQGAPAEYYDRYHICLANQPGSIFRAGEDQITMTPGDIWWFNNKAEHEVKNNSSDDRVVLIADIRSFK